MRHFKTFLIVVLVVIGTLCVFTAESQAQCCVAAPATAFAPPPVVYQPQMTYRPMYYQGSSFQRKIYPTPLRSMLFGSGVVTNTYGASGSASMAPLPQVSISTPTRAPVISQPALVPAVPVVPTNRVIVPSRVIVDFIE